LKSDQKGEIACEDVHRPDGVIIASRAGTDERAGEDELSGIAADEPRAIDGRRRQQRVSKRRRKVVGWYRNEIMDDDGGADPRLIEGYNRIRREHVPKLCRAAGDPDLARLYSMNVQFVSAVLMKYQRTALAATEQCSLNRGEQHNKTVAFI
jgi:hypothetical protein